MGMLRNKMIKDMELSGFSQSTIKAYLQETIGFVKFYGRSPRLLGKNEVKEYLYYLIKEKQCSSSKIGICYSSLKFLYEITLESKWVMDRIPRMKREKKLPIVLDKSEIKLILRATNNLKHRTILELIYSSGLRCSEAANLKIDDVNSERMQLRIEQGKGKKDRYTILSRTALLTLREYWKQYRPEIWLFPGIEPDKPIASRTILHIFTEAKKKSGIKKPVTVHTLRHSFATHLLDADCNILHIQSLLGHRSLRTTSKYLHLRRKDTLNIVSPLDVPDVLKD